MAYLEVYQSWPCRLDGYSSLPVTVLINEDVHPVLVDHVRTPSLDGRVRAFGA
jgi:hypothetical protein